MEHFKFDTNPANVQWYQTLKTKNDYNPFVKLREIKWSIHQEPAQTKKNNE